MLQREVFPTYRKLVSELTTYYEILKTQFDDGSIDELCAIRGYIGDEQRALMNELRVGSCEIDPSSLANYDKSLGMLSDRGYPILTNRFIIPVYSVNGDLVSLIGYFNDKRKYITLPTPFFSKEMMFFNFKQAYELSYKEYDGFVILVEGIFDCLSLRAIGLPAIATMGADVSVLKGELLKLFKKVLAIPDDDKVGRRSLNRYSKYGWKVPFNTTFLKFSGGYLDVGEEKLHCKDMDNFVSWYEPDDVREILLSYRDSKEDIEELTL